MSARSKGAGGEREACEWLERKIFGNVGLKRNLEQVRSGGADIIHHPFVVEVKRRKGDKNLGVGNWWIQVANATRIINTREQVDTYLPIVMFRIDRGEWEFLINANHLVKGISGYIRVDRIVFVKWARNYLGLDTT